MFNPFGALLNLFSTNSFFVSRFIFKEFEDKIIELLKTTNFDIVLKEFWKKESIYGFGDTQVKYLYDKVINHS